MRTRLRRRLSKVPVLLLAATLTATVVQARPHPRYVATPVDNGAGMQLTRKLDKRYYFYEHQFIRVLPLSRQYLNERNSLTQQATSDDDRRARLQQLDATFEQNWRQLLTPWQVERLHKAYVELAPKESFAHFLALQFA